MQQLELQLFGFDLPKLIDYFDTQELMYRWYSSEIVNRLSKITNDQMIIDHFKFHHQTFWYLDEIVSELKRLADGV